MATLSSRAQNLVPNPSFEVYSTCPDMSSQLPYAAPWVGITTNSTDYFNACSTGGTNVPYGAGFQYARSGLAYAGLWAVNPYGYNYREYAEVSLTQPLMADSCYIIEFYCSLSNVCRFGVNKLGACLSVSPLSMVGPGTVLQYVPQIESGTYLNDTLNWMRISGPYHALGGEQYITIGNFRTDSLTDSTHVGGTYPGAYYLIDDIKVERVAGCDFSGIREIVNSSKLTVYPNPADQQISIETPEMGTLMVSNITGFPVKQILITGKRIDIDISDLSSGVYFLSCKSMVKKLVVQH
jgi:hypothetical protein